MDSQQEKLLKSKNAELEKQLAAKNRTLEIEAALERVRARTMAMQHSEELAKTVSILFKELLGLGIKSGQIRTCGIVTFNTHEPVGEQWITETNGEIIPQSFLVPYNEAPAYKAIYEAWKKGEKFKLIHLEGEPLKQHLGYLAKYTKVPVRDVVTPQQAKEIYNHVLYFSQGCLFIITKEALPEYHDVFKRFGAVFQQSYTRFLDLKKSEAQSREVQIELALERVRARTMAMQKSEELAETAYILFQQFKELGENPDQATIGIINEEEHVIEYWVTMYGSQVDKVFKFSIDEPNVTNRIYKAWKKQQKSLVIDLTGKELEDFTTYRAKMGGAVRKTTEKRRVINVAFFSKGLINVQSTESRSVESIRLLERFAGVFDGTYTRFLDLQKAEAQVREARIEAALEKVRSRSLAMHNTGELQEVVNLVFEKLQEIGMAMDSVNISIPDEKTRSQMIWIAVNGIPYPQPVLIPDNDDPISSSGWEAWFSRVDYFSRKYSFEEKNQFYNWAFENSSLKYMPPERKALVMQSDGCAYSIAFGKVSGIWAVSYSGLLLNLKEAETLKRFGRVFEQAYVRFLDLQKAEARVREARIEAALERTRTQSMLMQHSTELDDTLRVFHQQVLLLGIRSAFSFLWLPDEDKDRHIFWAAWAENNSNDFRSKAIDYPLDRNEPATAQCLIDWKGNEPVVSYHVPPEGVESYFAAWRELIDGVEQLKPEYFTGGLYYVEAFMKYGCFGVMVENPLAEEEKKILGRFAVEFERTYTRFLDLQKAEAQVREARIEAALERIRSRSLAMHKSDELIDVVKVFFERLQELNFAIDGAAFIVTPGETPKELNFWIGDSHAEYPTCFKTHFYNSPVVTDIFDAIETGSGFLLRTYSVEEKNAWFKYAFKHTDYKHLPEELKSWILAQENLTQCFALAKNSGVGIHFHNRRPLSDDEIDILKRFSKVFEQSYIRFLDLQKAEAQAREAQIEAALERVRSRTIGMQKSEELAEVIQLVYDQLCQLNFNIDNANFVVNYQESDDLDLWLAVNGQRYSTKMHIPYLDHPIFNRLSEAKKKGLSFFSDSLTFEEKNTFFRHFFENAPQVPQERKKAVFESPGYARSVVFMKTIALSIQNYAAIPYSDAENEVLVRFGKVFEQTYTRFNDLKIAEEQVREATIEAALERVRSKTMAMHNSADVADATAVMFDELIKLGVEKMVRCGIGILSQSSSQMELWTAKAGESEKPELVIGHFDVNIHPMLKGIYDAWHKREQSFSYVLTGDDMVKYFEIINNQPDYPIKYDISKLPSKQYQNDFFFTEGALFAFTSQPLSDEISSVFKRFAGVFGQTYRRYFDLQKAEAQAREAQIELSLERVRAKTMAMHTSEHVGDTVATMFDELVKLGIEKTARCGIAIIGDNREMELWRASYNPDGKVDKVVGRIDMTVHPLLEGIYQAWKNKDTDYAYELTGKTQKDYFRALNNSPQYPTRFDLTSLPAKQINSGFFFPEGCVYAFTIEPLSADAVKLFKRFAGVFGLTYRRFLDLQKAEAAAREAQIEAALERVRGKAMAMRSSYDLNATANTVFIELRKLGVDLVRCGLGLMEKESHISTIHAATNSAEGGSLEVLGNIDMNIHPVLEGIYNHWRQNKDYFPVLEAESLRTYYEALHESGISVPKWKSGEKQYGYFLQFAYGSLYAWSGKQESEITIKTLKRFTSVIGLTYTRYIELQKAESNTKEAIKQASLDRVRAEIASMRKRSDLERITPLIWDELTILGIPFIRCGVFIMDEEHKLIHTFLSTPDGKAIGAFNIPFDTSGNFELMVDNWRNKVPYIDHWKEEAFSQFADALVKQGAISSKAQYMRTLPHEGVHLNFLPFLQGMLYVGNVLPLAEDNIDLIQAVADAFSTAYARYEDFNKLEAAKQQVENTLSDLKAAQTKLIQSEKMASLGELTAGIAHEIQNPLNFVNNFSEVNQEMIDELEEELKAGNIEEALAIAADIKQNEEKISHHGKRADGIVKGMLQHSRTGGGEKQLTNMNTLADEFLRLSYHGLRAKDKTFNAEMVTHFDSDLPKISVIPQDMGRVMLNLFNNAFYAVNQKKKTALPDYKPEVSVTTSTENGQLIIKVKDNGTGMPDNIKEKIMQPFFTTKPTGEGTGLGLSLTYDMVVKGHGGSIVVDTKEGEFTEFRVRLPVQENNISPVA